MKKTILVALVWSWCSLVPLYGFQGGGIAPIPAGNPNKPMLITLAQGVYTMPTGVNTIPANVTLAIQNGATLQIASGKTVTFNGILQAGIYPVFSGSGTVNLGGHTAIVYPQWFGAKANGAKLTNCTMANASKSVSCVGSSFTSADVGKLFDMQGASSTGLNIVGTISTVVSPTAITVSVAAGTTATSQNFLFGSDDRGPINSAVVAGGGATVMFPAGNYIVGSGVTLGAAAAYTVFKGDGMNASTLYAIGPKSDRSVLFSIFTAGAGADYMTIRDMGFAGTNWNGTTYSLGTSSDGFATTGANAHYLKVTNARFDSTWGIGLHAVGGSLGWQVTASQANYNSFDGFNPNSDGLVFMGNTANYNGTGGIETAGRAGTSITGNYFRGNKGACIAFGGSQSSGDVSLGGVISANTCRESYQGIVISTNVQGATVSGNSIYKMDQYGILVVVASFASTTPTSNTLIANNNILSVGCTVALSCVNGVLPANPLTAGIFSDSPNTQVIGNAILTTAATANFTHAAGVVIVSNPTAVTGAVVVGNITTATVGNSYKFANTVTGALFEDYTGVANFSADATVTFLAGSTVLPKIVSGFQTGAGFTQFSTVQAFSMSVGSGGTAVAVGVIGLPTAKSGWICSIVNATANTANRADQSVRQTASTTTSATFQNQSVALGTASNWTASDTLRGSCDPY